MLSNQIETNQSDVSYFFSFLTRLGVSFSNRVFFSRLCLFSEIYFPGNYFLNFAVFVCFLESWSTENTFRSTENTFRSKKKFAWFSGKCFPENLGGKHFPEVVKNLEMSLFADYIKFDSQTFDCYI